MMHVTIFRSIALAAPFACAVVAASAPAHADADERWPHRYAHDSISLLGGGSLTVGDPYAGDPQGNLSLLLTATPRFVLSHFVLQPSAGLSYTNLGGAGSAQTLGLVLGFAGGYAFAVHDRLALSPMVGFDFGFNHAQADLPIVGVTNHDTTQGRLYAELPLEIFIGRTGFIEPYVDLGVAFPFTSNVMGSTTVFAFGLGYRIGVVF